jgi:arylsulfatase A-like enzyme
MVSKVVPRLQASTYAQAGARPNIVILVLDAMSASNLSLYGYRRRTTPNFERFAERANVYHAHYSGGSFTTPGTASLLTGLYPWTHRAINASGLIARHLTAQNLFRAVGSDYHRLVFSQNIWCYYLFGQFQEDIERALPAASFSLVNQIAGDIAGRDLSVTHRAFDDFLFQDGAPPGSLVFGLSTRILQRRGVARATADDYPRGLPRTGNYAIFFRLRDVFDGLINTVEQLPSPSVAYLHIWSPHAPYRASGEFDRMFMDGWRPKQKPDHVLGDHRLPRQMNDRRQNYDEYIADVDAEFGRMLDVLEAGGVLEKSHLVVTSDHGELLERGVEGHITPLLYDPVVRVPLLISSPGQRSRLDIDSPTSAVDLVPTLAHLTGAEIPTWSEGQLLPGLGGTQEPERHVFMMDAKTNPSLAPLAQGSFALRTPQHKLIYYRGFGQYSGKDHFELYDLNSDHEELIDLYPQGLPIGQSLQAELLAKIEAADLKGGS